MVCICSGFQPTENRATLPILSPLPRHRGQPAGCPAPPLPEEPSEVSPYRAPRQPHVSASPRLKATGLLVTAEMWLNRNPRSESVAVGLSKIKLTMPIIHRFEGMSIIFFHSQTLCRGYPIYSKQNGVNSLWSVGIGLPKSVLIINDLRNNCRKLHPQQGTSEALHGLGFDSDTYPFGAGEKPFTAILVFLEILGSG